MKLEKFYIIPFTFIIFCLGFIAHVLLTTGEMNPPKALGIILWGLISFTIAAFLRYIFNQIIE